jgi:glyoxylase-like metal-dependent hydrolase (beta-lactamase superfamily II)
MGRQLSALVGLLVLLAMMAAPVAAQAQSAQTAQTVLQAAAKAMGTNNLKCVTYTGAGYVGIVGQNHNIRDDWARVELANYTRTINFEARSSQEERVTRQGNYPARGGGGIPLTGEQRQTQFVVDKVAWNVGANGMPAPAPQAAEMRALDIYLNPHGFLKGAMAPGANPVLITRWESGAVGGLSSTVQRRLNIISFVALGKYRINGTINDQNLVERVQTLVPNPVRGDMNQEGEYTQWRDVEGVKWPGNFHHHTDWDDETQPPNYNGGHNSLTFTVKDIKVNACANIPVPEAVAKATVPPVTVETTKLAEGVYYLTGGSHHSVAVEFKDFTAVVEAPQDEARVLAVIEAVYKAIPNKPIRYVVNSHHHFDHLGGLRTMFHEGATIVTHASNRDFYKQELLTYAPRLLQPDRLSLYPPTEFAEGYQLETVDIKGTISDGTRNLDVYYVQGSPHSEGMLMAYLPRERILIEADIFTPPAAGAQPPATPPPSAVNLYENVKAYKLDVQQLAPLHGRVVPWGDFLKFVARTE